MKTCPKCGAQIADDAGFCTVCGFNFNTAAGAAQGAPQGAPQPQYQQTQYQQAPAAHPMYQPVNPCDKLLGIVALCGFFGVILAYFGGDVNGQRSDYLRFYANEGLVFALFALIGIIPILGWIWSVFNTVCLIIALVYACKGETKPVLFYGAIRIIK